MRPRILAFLTTGNFFPSTVNHALVETLSYVSRFLVLGNQNRNFIINNLLCSGDVIYPDFSCRIRKKFDIFSGVANSIIGGGAHIQIFMFNFFTILTVKKLNMNI